MKKSFPDCKKLAAFSWIHCIRLLMLASLLLPALRGARGFGQEIRGLTEPYRTIDVAAQESGVIAELHVREGQEVARQEVLATLDCKLYQAELAIAKQNMDARGRLEAAQAELQLRQDRARNFAAVFAQGHANSEELQRAKTDLAIAEANLHTAQEELILKRLEHEKISAQIDRRRVVAPIQGIVARFHKEEGEFVAPNDPSVLTLVQLDPLLAVFSLTLQQAHHLSVGQAVTIRMSDGDQRVTAVVEFISPVADAESGTLLVKIRVKNPHGWFRSGTRCTLELPPAVQAVQDTRAAESDTTDCQQESGRVAATNKP